MTEMWDVVAAERGALADQLAGLAEARWDTPSLCSGWTVRQVLAHMASTPQFTPAGFVGGMVRSGFRFNRLTEHAIEQNLGASPAETLATFRSVQHSRKAPPGPKVTWLGETIIHAEDIRRPLGIAHDYPTASVVEVADFYKGSNMMIGAKNRIAGVTLRATDTEWTHGEGPLAEGPILSLLMMMTGRAVAIEDLSGEGVATLRTRD